MRRDARLAAAMVVVVLVAPACIRPPRAGVNVKSITTELVFGVPPDETAVTPANTSLEPEAPTGLIVTSTGPAITPRPAVRPSPSPQCREAGPTDFPDQSATTVVNGRPKEGQYRWNVEGSQSVTGVGQVPLPTTTRRSVREVKGASDAFTFVTEERELVFGSTTIVRTTYEVRSVAGSGRDPGIYLARIERIAGGRTSVFAPQPPVLYLPTPVQIGAPPGPGGTRAQDQIDSVGIDPTTLQALRHTGNVTKRQRVDACGKVLDSWFVDASQEFVDPDGQTERRNYDYGVATQYGGLIVLEHVQTPCGSEDDAGKCNPAPTLSFVAGIGQIDPEPLPAS